MKCNTKQLHHSKLHYFTLHNSQVYFIFIMPAATQKRTQVIPPKPKPKSKLTQHNKKNNTKASSQKQCERVANNEGSGGDNVESLGKSQKRHKRMAGNEGSGDDDSGKASRKNGVTR